MQQHNRMFSTVRVVSAILSVILLGGCTFDSTWSFEEHNSQLSLLDGSASMRVEVEVYKGPLSKEVPIQLAELSGVLEDSRRALEILYANMTVSASRLGCLITTHPLKIEFTDSFELMSKLKDQLKRIFNSRLALKMLNELEKVVKKLEQDWNELSESLNNKIKSLKQEKKVGDLFSEVNTELTGLAEQLQSNPKSTEVLNKLKNLQTKAEQLYQEFLELKRQPTTIVARKNGKSDGYSSKSRTRLLYDANTIQRPGNMGTYEILIPTDDKIKEDERFIFCNTLGQMLIDAKTVYSEFPSKATKNFKTCLATGQQKNSGKNHICLPGLMKVARFGAFLERRASYWATEHVASMPSEKRMRIEMANFAQFFKEYGNQINARADALAKQIAGAGGMGIVREQLANSVFLRDSAPTSYLNLYKWNNAAVWRENFTQGDRIRMVEQLVADTYWSKINTVFAAGQGDVSMALVKDDIGNWNLKSFDNSPGELLNAYKGIGLAAVKAVVEIAGNATDLSKAKNALNFANQIALGSTSGGRAKETAQRLASLREESARRIQAIGVGQKVKKDELEKKIKKLDDEIGADETKGLRKAKKDAETELTNAKSNVSTKQDDLKNTNESLVAQEAKISANKNELKNLREKRDALQKQDDERPPPETGNPPLKPNPELAGIDKQIGTTSEELEKNAIEFARLAELKKTQTDALVKAKADVKAKTNKLNKAKAALVKKSAERIVFQSAKDNLTKDTADQIQQLLELNAALVARMSEAAVEASGQNKLK